MYKNTIVKPSITKNPPKILNYGFIDTPDYGKMLAAFYVKEETLHICNFRFALKQTMEQYVNDLQKMWPKSECLQDDKLAARVFANFTTKQQESCDVHVVLNGSDFQVKVWSALLEILYGEERTYGEVATMIGKPKAARAVGNAVGSNDIVIFVPCHRVKARTNDKYKYGPGSELKQKILLNEQKRK